jgi:hypothetical protein
MAPTLFSPARRGVESFLGAPSPFINACADGRLVDPGGFGPLRQSFHFSAALNNSVSGCVVRLFDGARPPAVFRLVVAAAVDAIYRVLLGRGASHVVKKVVEAFGPSRTDLHPASAVMRPSLFGRQFAAPLHAPPRSILLSERVPEIPGSVAVFVPRMIATKTYRHAQIISFQEAT